MSFTLSLRLFFHSPLSVPSPAPSLDAKLWRFSTTIDGNGGSVDHEVEVESHPVQTSISTGFLTSPNFTFNQDVPFPITHTDFGVVTLRNPSDAGFLFRSALLKENPHTSNGTVAISVTRLSFTRTQSDLQAIANQNLPKPVQNLPPGFSGSITKAVVSLQQDAVMMALTGSISPPQPQPPPKFGINLPSLPTLSAPPPIGFTLTTTVGLAPTPHIQVKRQVACSTQANPNLTFAGSNVPSNVVAAVLNFLQTFMSGTMAEAVSSAFEQSIDQIVQNQMSATPLATSIISAITASVQRVKITSANIAFDIALGSFVKIPNTLVGGIGNPVHP
jgi:hypothetical protein